MHVNLVLRMACAFGALLLLQSPALANRYGVLRVTSNTVLQDDQFGSVVFDADNVTLDCNYHQVHISSRSVRNCGPSLDRKCAILANGRHNIHIKNCNIMGRFDYGLHMTNTTASTVDTVISTGPNIGFQFAGNDGIHVETLLGEDNQTGIAIYSDSYGTYEFIQSSGTTDFGIVLVGSHGTYVEDPMTSYTDVGFALTQNTEVVLADAASFFNRVGLQTNNVENSVLLGSIFRFNVVGLDLTGLRDSTIANNVVTNNSAACQASQGPGSSGNSFFGNTFASYCNIPANH